MTRIPKPTHASLLKNKQWSIVDGELLRITDFSPLLGSRMEGQVVVNPEPSAPYASVLVECRKLPQDIQVTGYITHKMDFANLWTVFRERGVGPNEEVLAYWSNDHYASRLMRPLSATLPKLVIMVSPQGTYQSISDRCQWPPEEEALVMVHSLEAKAWWIPEVIR